MMLRMIFPVRLFGLLLGLLAFSIFWGGLLPDSGQIAFETNSVGGDADLFLLDLRTRIAHNLTRGSIAHETSPAWSPDGGGLAFARLEGATRGGSIWVMRVPTGQAQALPNAAGLLPVWSPNGRHIAFTRGEQVVVQTLDGEQGDSLRAPEWTPAGLRWLLAAAEVLPAHRLAQTNPATVTATLAGSIVDPSWSGDQRTVAFALWDGVTTSVFVLASECLPRCDGSAQLVPGTEGGRDPTLAPDGTRLAYICRVGGHNELCVVNADGSRREQLTHSGRGVYQRAPAWRP
jgi:TolB protein